MSSFKLSVNLADDGVDDTYDVTLDLGGKPSWSWKLAGTGDTGSQAFAASVLAKARAAQWLSQGSAISTDDSPLTRALPACLIARDAFAKLAAGKEVTLPGLWGTDEYVVSAQKVIEVAVKVGKKSTNVRALRCTGGANIDVLASADAPFVLALEDGDCSYKLANISALPAMTEVTLPERRQGDDHDLVMRNSAPEPDRLAALDRVAKVPGAATIKFLFEARARLLSSGPNRIVMRACVGHLDARIRDAEFPEVVEGVFRLPPSKKTSQLQSQVANFFGHRHKTVASVVQVLEKLSKELPPEQRELVQMALGNVRS